jgi:hypothetical protein
LNDEKTKNLDGGWYPARNHSLSRVLARLDEHCEHVLVHTGQNYDYELNQSLF